MLRDGRTRYLSKNNNNVLRLGALREAFPDARFVHPFRVPLQQVGSLMRQHARALVAQADDPFRRRYMTWLGHHEFGTDLRPMDLTDRGGAPELRTPDDWLRLWIVVHRRLLDTASSTRFLLDYDALAAEPGPGLESLATLTGVLPETLGTIPIVAAPLHSVEGADPALVREADALHDTLRTSAGSA